MSEAYVLEVQTRQTAPMTTWISEEALNGYVGGSAELIGLAAERMDRMLEDFLGCLPKDRQWSWFHE